MKLLTTVAFLYSWESSNFMGRACIALVKRCRPKFIPGLQKGVMGE